LFMKTHGGRSFLHGHVFGDNVHEYLAPCIYEGEGEMLGLAFFKSIVKEHGKAFFEPIGKALQQKKMKSFSATNPLHAWALRDQLKPYMSWYMNQKMVKRDRQQVPGMDPRLSEHIDFALHAFQSFPLELSGTLRK